MSGLPPKNSWPKAIRKRDHWIHWRNEDGVKVPYRVARHDKASSTDPETWDPFFEAYRCFDPDKRSGLSYVLTADDPFVVLDLDKVIRDGEIAPWATKLIRQLDSLTYKSVSGTGFHIWTRSRVPLPGPNLSIKWPSMPETALEVFGSKRFLVMSGDIHLKRPIRDCTNQVQKIYRVLKRKRDGASPLPAYGACSGSCDASLRDWLDRYGVHYVVGSTSSADDGISYKIECPWGDEHTGGKNGIGHAAVFVKGGKWAFSCCHTHDKSFREFSDRLRPIAASRPIGSKISFGRRRK